MTNIDKYVSAITKIASACDGPPCVRVCSFVNVPQVDISAFAPGETVFLAVASSPPEPDRRPRIIKGYGRTVEAAVLNLWSGFIDFQKGRVEELEKYARDAGAEAAAKRAEFEAILDGDRKP